MKQLTYGKQLIPVAQSNSPLGVGVKSQNLQKHARLIVDIRNMIHRWCGFVIRTPA